MGVDASVSVSCLPGCLFLPLSSMCSVDAVLSATAGCRNFAEMVEVKAEKMPAVEAVTLTLSISRPCRCQRPDATLWST